MLSIQECRKILEKHGEKHTDKEIEQIRDLLFRFAKYQIKDIENNQYEKCDSIHKGFNGRTS